MAEMVCRFVEKEVRESMGSEDLRDWSNGMMQEWALKRLVMKIHHSGIPTLRYRG
jgi:hypothetical protein